MKYVYSLCVALMLVSFGHVSFAKVVLPNTVEASSHGNTMRNDVDLGDNLDPFDASDPKDSILNLRFEPNRIYKIRLWPGMSTYLHFPSGETIERYDLGNNYSFAAKEIYRSDSKEADILALFSSHYETHTTLNVIGSSGQTYSFYLRSDPMASQHVPHTAVYIRSRFPMQFNAPGHKSNMASDKQERLIKKRVKEAKKLGDITDDYLNQLDEASQINPHYSMHGDAQIAPFAVWSDDRGRTYFDFRDGPKSGVLPAVFQVIGGYDSIVHPRYVNGYLIADTVSDGWTLRRGEMTVCVRRTKTLQRKRSEPKAPIPKHRRQP